MATALAPSPTLVRERRAYATLRVAWRESPRLYVRHRFGAVPTWQQEDILDAITPPGAKVTVRSGHGIGKSSAAAWGIYWFIETHDYAKIPCTAPSSHQLRDVLWGELSKWQRIADALSETRKDPAELWLSALFTLAQGRLSDPGAPEWAAIARTARKENPEALQGFHAEHMFFVVDEASGVPEEIFEAAEGALSTPGARVLMLGNPTRTSGTFHGSHVHNRGEYTPLHFRSQDSPLVDANYRARLVRKWGEGSNVVRVRADGEFPRQEDDVLISLEHTEPCTTREPVAGEGRRRLGVDVARYGSDRTTLVSRQGRVVDYIRIYAQQGTMETVGCILAVIEPWGIQEIDVDLIGIGAGVYDRLVEVMADRRRLAQYACAVVGVNVATDAPDKRPSDDAQARTMRDYVWLEVARWLREDAPVFCAEDRQACEDLAGELASVHYRFDSDGRIVVEAKDAMKKRLGHSPDLADGLGCTFAPPEPVKRAGAWGRS
jgi:phage terminase large subunit